MIAKDILMHGSSSSYQSMAKAGTVAFAAAHGLRAISKGELPVWPDGVWVAMPGFSVQAVCKFSKDGHVGSHRQNLLYLPGAGIKITLVHEWMLLWTPDDITCQQLILEWGLLPSSGFSSSALPRNQAPQNLSFVHGYNLDMTARKAFMDTTFNASLQSWLDPWPSVFHGLKPGPETWTAHTPCSRHMAISKTTLKNGLECFRSALPDCIRDCSAAANQLDV